MKCNVTVTHKLIIFGTSDKGWYESVQILFSEINQRHKFQIPDYEDNRFIKAYQTVKQRLKMR